MTVCHRSILLTVLGGLLCSPAMAQRAGFRPDSGRDCALCHTEWVESFKRPRAVNLMEEPDKPLVAEQETCLGCHDGSVADSRREVWLDHGHQTGATPSAGMKVPAELPLEGGRMACRTCHTAHNNQAEQSLKDVFFLRMRNDQGQLCQSCHTDKSQGPAAGTHPIGKLPWALPGKLKEAGSHAGADNQQLVCQTCHTAHGAKQDNLLLMATDSSQLCVTCHEQMRPAMWDQDAAHEHPQNPRITRSSDIKAIEAMGTRLGTDNRLICLSCHKMHHGQSGRAMLADTMHDSRLCIRCHEDRATVAGSAHDLRKTAPNELNRSQQTAEQSGPCGACHTFHSYARDLKPKNGDPQGLCTTCHDEGQVAARHNALTFSHPGEIDQRRIPKDTRLTLYPSKDDPDKKSVACLSCHNPHETQQNHFLLTTGDDLCGSCHSEHSRSLAGSHDFTKEDFRNARGRTAAETGKCGFCHAVHNANGPTMWVGTKNTPKTTDDLCAECHSKDGLAGKHPVAMFNHPTGPKARPSVKQTSLPLFDESSHQRPEGFVTCASCHNVHISKTQSGHLLRSADATSLCTQCHLGQSAVAGGLHDPRAAEKPWMGKMDKNADLCTSCHRPHSNDPGKQRWAVTIPKDADKDEAACMGCHPSHGTLAAREGEKPHVGAMLHPATVSADSPIRKLEHGLPVRLDHRLGEEEVVCKTCHNPHAGAGAKHLLRIDENARASELCLKCHEEPRHVTKGMHSPELLDADKPGNHACLPCHATHAVEGSVRKLLWAAKTSPSGTNDSEKACLGCHDGKTAEQPTIFRHPETALLKIAQAATRPTEIESRLKMVGEITCSTCHLAHGREVPEHEVPPELRRTRLSSVKPMLKPDVDRNLCANCHGIDSTRVYLYFHNAKKRSAAVRLLHD